MAAVKRVLTARITTGVFDRRLVPYVFFTAGIAVLFLGLRKLATLELTEAQVFFGVVQVLTLSLVTIGIGLVFDPARFAETHKSE